MSKLGFGCFGLTGAYGGSALDDEAAAAVIAHAFRRGFTFFDTSDIYGPLTNEILVGKVRPSFPHMVSSTSILSYLDFLSWATCTCRRAPWLPATAVTGVEEAAAGAGAGGHKVRGLA